MNLNLLITRVGGRWVASDRVTGATASARNADTAIGRLILVLVYQGHIQTGPNIGAIIGAMREQSKEGGGA